MHDPLPMNLGVLQQSTSTRKQKSLIHFPYAKQQKAANNVVESNQLL